MPASHDIQETKDAEWIVGLMIRERMNSRTPLPTQWNPMQNKDLQDVIDHIRKAEYKQAKEKLVNVPVPAVNGQETVFKLHARMIVEAYRDQTEVMRGGKLFSMSGLSSQTGPFLRDLKAFIRESDFDAKQSDFEALLLKHYDGAGKRLKLVLSEYGVTPERIDSMRNQTAQSLAEEVRLQREPVAA